MISYPHAIILGLLQGISELFPISSLGHSVLVPNLLGWKVGDPDTGAFLTFLVATHLATALVLLGFYWKEWLNILQGMGRSFMARKISDTEPMGKLGWLLVLGTLPTAILALLFKDQVQHLFSSPQIVAAFLVINGFMLYAAEYLRTNKKLGQTLAQLTFVQAFGVGLSQVLALIPGLSRSGATMSGGLVVGLSHEEAVHFAFLLATPIILAAALVQLPMLFQPEYRELVGPALAGSIAAAMGAFFAARYLVQHIQTKKLTPFALYCVIAGLLSMLALAVRS